MPSISAAHILHTCIVFPPYLAGYFAKGYKHHAHSTTKSTADAQSNQKPSIDLSWIHSFSCPHHSPPHAKAAV